MHLLPWSTAFAAVRHCGLPSCMPRVALMLRDRKALWPRHQFSCFFSSQLLAASRFHIGRREGGMIEI